MKINTLHNLLSKLLIIRYLRSVAFLCAFLLLGFNGFGQTVTIADENGDEDAGVITLTATLDIAVAGGFMVDVSTVDGTATILDNDYTAVSSFTLTFIGLAGENQTFTILPTADSFVEPDENLTVGMDNLQLTLTPVDINDTATITINNDDSELITMDSDVAIAEGNAGATAFNFTANRTGSTAAAATVTYTVTGVSADAADFDGGVFPTGLATFAIGSSTADFTINVNGDTAVEANETFTVTLSAPSAGYALGTPSTATGTINNDDSELITMDSDVAIAEGNAGATAFNFTANRTGSTAAAATVTYTVTGVSADAADFDGGVFPTGLATFAIGSSTANFTINVNGDTAVEANETFTVTLSAPSAGYALGTPSTATGTINNDDSELITMDSDVSLAEGNAGATAFNFTANRTGSTAAAATVTYTVTGVSADAADFDGGVFPTGLATFAIGSSTANFTINVNGDTAVEANETFTVTLSAPSAGYALGTPSTATGTINNDDSELITMDSDVSLAEGNAGATAFNFTANRTGSTAAAATVTYTVTGVSADAVDFDGGVFPTGLATFAIGSSTANFTINVNGDTAVEANETFTVTLSAPSAGYALGTPSTATGTINNDDSELITMDSDVAIAEGNAGATAFNFTANRTGSTAAAATVTYTVTGVSADAADFDGGVFPTGLATFAIGSSTADFTINVNGDTAVEANETFTVTLSAPSAGYALGTPSAATGTINNDDSYVASITANDATATEAGTTTGEFTVDLGTANTTGGDIVVNFSIATGGSNATNTTDYADIGTSVSIADGDQTGTITITPVNDALVEGPETVILTLAAGTGYVVAGAPNNTATVTITDDDTAGVSIDDVSVNEGDGTATFTVTLNGALLLGTTVSFVTANSTALAGSDYEAQSSSVIFAPLIANQTRTITIDINEDTLVEGNETFFVNLTNATGFAQIGKAQGVGTILDNDSYIATITATDADAAESPLDPGTYTVGLNTTNLTGSPMVINYTVSGTAVTGTDYIALSGTVSIGDGQESASITLTPINDSEVEVGLETVIVTLASGTGYTVGAPNNATVNIDSEDVAGISIDDVVVNESDGTATFTVTLNANVPAGATVSYATSNDSAAAGTDYVADSGTLSFSGLNNETQTIVIDILEDTLAEGTENFFVNLSNPTGLIQIDKAQGVGTIADNDNCMEAPLINSTPTIFCDAFTQDLDAYTDSPVPAGFELIWSSNSDFSIEGARLNTSVVDFEATFYGFLYNESTDCLSPPLEVTLVRNVPPEVLSTAPTTICGNGSATISATVTDGGSLFWYSSESGGMPLGEGSNFVTPSIEETTTYWVEASANECITERTPVIVTVADLVDVGTTSDDTACSIAGGGATTTVDLDDTRSAGDSGVWSIVGTPPSTVTIAAGNIVDFEGAVEGEYVFRFTTNTAVSPCVDESVDVTITVSTCTMDSDEDGLLDRDETALGLNPNLRDTDADGIDDGVEVGPDINNPIDTDSDGIIDALDSNILDQDNDGIVDQLDPANDNPCIPNISAACQIDLAIEKVVDKESILVGREVTFTVTLTNLSQIMVTNIAVNDLVSSANGFQYVSSSTTKGVYDELAGVWQLDEVLAEEVNTLTITAIVPEIGTYQNIAAIVDSFPEDSNATNNTATATVTGTPRSTEECGFLFNQISPNADGINDTVFINCITDYPNNTLQIFDRYGNEVFSANGYDNTWMGTGKNGDLPKGTYFYILDLGDGSEVRKGWIQIIR